jgi:AraC family transcriptional regulator
MNNSKVFDDVIRYLEQTILEGSEVEESELSNITLSPAALFQRVFIFLSGISIAEYVRKRKLTLAGLELQNSEISVLDVAIKYGFQSHSAFSRAFKQHHGMTPLQARQRFAKLNAYLPLEYLDMRFIGGKRIMAQMKQITYKQTPERLMVGAYHNTSFAEAGAAWEAYYQSDVNDKLQTIAGETCCDDIAANAGIGMMYNFRDMNHFEFIIGDFMRSGTVVPEGLQSKLVPDGLSAHIQIEGNSIPDILESAYLLITEAIEKTGKRIDLEHFYWCEIYTLERFCDPLSRGEKVTIDYLIPVLPAQP